MSIRSVGPLPSVPPTSPSGSSGFSTDAPVSASADTGAVHLSGASQGLQAALQDPSHDVDVAQVSALRQAVADGLYQPNPQAIADGMLASVKDLLKTRKKGARQAAQKF